MHEQMTDDNGNVFTLTNIYTFGVNGHDTMKNCSSRTIFEEEQYYHEKSSTGCRIVVFCVVCCVTLLAYFLLV